MAFHACASGECASGPGSHKVYLAQSDDGGSWSLVPGWTPFQGSVPDVIRRGGTLYIYTPGKLARYNLETGAVDGPLDVKIQGLDQGIVDPSLILDDQGRLVLFFLYGRIGGDPAGCPAGQDSCEQRFGSATEVEGSDGTLFALDNGDRVTVTVSRSSDSTYKSASDPDIFFDGRQYVLYLSHGQSTSVWIAAGLRDRYTSVSILPQALLTDRSCGIASGHFDIASSHYWLFCHRSSPGAGTMIYSARHSDFSRQLGQDDLKAAISGESIGLGPGFNVESPGFAVNQP